MKIQLPRQKLQTGNTEKNARNSAPASQAQAEKLKLYNEMDSSFVAMSMPITAVTPN